MKAMSLVVQSAIVLAVVAPVANVPSAAEAAGATKTVTAQAAYDCQGKAAGFPPDADTMSIQIQLNVPTSVAPGDTVSLRGSMTIQFSENLRQKTKLVGVDTIDVFSTSINIYRTVGSQSAAPYVAERWQTGPTPVKNPVEVRGALSFPAFKVPADASGVIKLQLPQNGSTKNLASSSPSTVAFNSNVHAYGPAASIKVIMSCFLPRSTPGVLASIPIAARSTGGSGSGSDANGGAAAPTGAPTAGQTTTGGVGQPAEVPGSDSANALAPTGTGQPVGGGQPQTTAVGQQYVPAAGPVADETDGVHLSSSVIVLGGFLLCMLALGYALLSNYRLRTVRKAINK